MDRSQTRSSTLAIREFRAAITCIASVHGARDVRVFGSANRGETRSTSDLNLLVDMSDGRSLFDLIALANKLEDALGLRVNVLTEGSLSPYLRERILAEAVPL